MDYPRELICLYDSRGSASERRGRRYNLKSLPNIVPLKNHAQDSGFDVFGCLLVKADLPIFFMVTSMALLHSLGFPSAIKATHAEYGLAYHVNLW